MDCGWIKEDIIVSDVPYTGWGLLAMDQCNKIKQIKADNNMEKEYAFSFTCDADGELVLKEYTRDSWKRCRGQDLPDKKRIVSDDYEYFCGKRSCAFEYETYWFDGECPSMDDMETRNYRSKALNQTDYKMALYSCYPYNGGFISYSCSGACNDLTNVSDDCISRANLIFYNDSNCEHEEYKIEEGMLWQNDDVLEPDIVCRPIDEAMRGYYPDNWSQVVDIDCPSFIEYGEEHVGFFLSKAALTGIIIGGIITTVLFILCCCFCYIKKKQKKREQTTKKVVDNDSIV